MKTLLNIKLPFLYPVIFIFALTLPGCDGSGTDSRGPDAEGPDYLFTMDSDEEVSAYDNDGTGARFDLSGEVYRVGGKSVKVTPSGSADETKLALPLEGSRVQQWLGHDGAAIHVYRPEANRLNPDHFFLGMSDVTGGDWSWVEGTFWDEDELSEGWNKIRFTLPDEMKQISADGQYTIFFFFITHMPPREDNIPLPLYEPFFIDGIHML